MQITTTKLLRDKNWVFAQSQNTSLWGRILTEFILVGIISAALFGVVMATYDFSWENAGILAGKVVILLWGPMAICLPSLFVFGAIRGSQMKFWQLTYLALGSLATTGIVLLSLTPIVWFFTWTSNSISVIQAMDALAIGVTLIFGLFFLGKSFIYINQTQKSNDEKVIVATDILYVWFILLVVVIIQMGAKLGPWYG